jgi:ATP-dependent Clp endopeptidase proteolytic subunit ClpP
MKYSDFYETTDVSVGPGIIFITGEIELETASKVNFGLWEFEWDPEFEGDITLIINSPGGKAAAGWSIINTMKTISHKVNTIGNGNIESMAIFLFAAGHHRSLYENTLCLLHHFSGEMSGTYLDFKASQRSCDIEYDRCIEHLKKVSKYKTEKRIRQHLLKDQDYFLTASEMVEHGLCDEIIKV